MQIPAFAFVKRAALPAVRASITFGPMSADPIQETFAERLARLEEARANARLARQALEDARGKKLPRKPRGVAKAARSSRATKRPQAKRSYPADPSFYLNSPEAIAAYLTQVLADEGAGYVAGALGFVARARGMAEIARVTGLSRESLYRALKASGNPEFSTILKVLAALKLRITVEPLE